MAHDHWIRLRNTRLRGSEVAFYLRSGCLQFGLFMGYQTAAEWSFNKAHTAFLKARKQRENSQIPRNPTLHSKFPGS